MGRWRAIKSTKSGWNGFFCQCQIFPCQKFLRSNVALTDLYTKHKSASPNNKNGETSGNGCYLLLTPSWTPIDMLTMAECVVPMHGSWKHHSSNGDMDLRKPYGSMEVWAAARLGFALPSMKRSISSKRKKTLSLAAICQTPMRASTRKRSFVPCYLNLACARISHTQLCTCFTGTREARKTCPHFHQQLNSFNRFYSM